MKRSEMITNIVKDHDGKYDKNTVHEILFSLEAYGMLPPEIRRIGIGDFEEDCTRTHLDDCYWEKETVTVKDPGHFPGDEFEYEMTHEELLEQEMCPCGLDKYSYNGCSVNGCTLYLYEESKKNE